MDLELPLRRCNVAGEPKIKDVGGDVVCEFRVAIPQLRRAKTGQWETIGTDFATVEVWGASARNVAASIKKGHPLKIAGPAFDKSWTNSEGLRVENMVIRPTVIGFDFAMSTAEITRTKAKGRSSQAAEQVVDAFASHNDVDFDGWENYPPEATDYRS